MRVITQFFSLESQRLALGFPVDCAPNGSTPATVKEVINAYREWLGMHEGEDRIAQLGKSGLGCAPRHKKAQLKVFFSTVLIHEPRKRT